jgi:CBS domain containing-hemolysin-like protein
MELPVTFGLLTVVLLVLANAFFVATEFAIVAVRRSRLDQLAAEGHASARSARDVVAVLNGVGNAVLRLLGLEPATGHEQVHSVGELRLLVTGMQQAGAIESSEARIATRAFHFGDLPAGALMTPRTEIEAVATTSSLPELLERAVSSTHSRWLVYDGSLDNIVGVLPVRRLFRLLGKPFEASRLQPLLRPVLVAPASKRADDLLDELRTSRRQVAILLDEYGGTAGMVTLEQEAREVDTLGGVVMHRLGRIPSVGDEVRLEGWLVRVEELDGHRAARVRVVPAGPPATPSMV